MFRKSSGDRKRLVNGSTPNSFTCREPRGDSILGEDIFLQIQSVKNIPQELKDTDFLLRTVVLQQDEMLDI